MNTIKFPINSLCLGSSLGTTLRKCYSTGTKEMVVPMENSFSLVYRLPQISICSLFNKFKKYQLIAAGAGVPISFGLQAFDLCDQTVPIIFSTVGLASTVAVFSMGHLFTDLVGMVYVSKDRTHVRISYLNFWGDRLDKTVASEDVIGVTVKKTVPWDVVNVAGSPDYKISLRFGEILMTPLFVSALKHDPDVGVK